MQSDRIPGPVKCPVRGVPASGGEPLGGSVTLCWLSPPPSARLTLLHSLASDQSEKPSAFFVRKGKSEVC